MYLLTKNAVVISDDGTNVKYQGKCPRCGSLDSTVQTMPVGMNATNGTGHCCLKCGQGSYSSRLMRSSYYKDNF